jgi:mono/diheme cytochrome c family protein
VTHVSKFGSDKSAEDKRPVAGSKEEAMDWPRRMAFWSVALLLATTVLAATVFWTQRSRQWWANFLVGNPHTGAAVFQRGCGQCHSVNGNGRGPGPDLGFDRAPHATLNELVAAMWNHAPVMWNEIRTRKVKYPNFDTEDMAHMASYLYASRYVDEPGDSLTGRRLFQEKGCIQCHSIRGEGGRLGPDLSNIGIDTPIAWTQAMWNHAPAMETEIRKIGMSWPKFQAKEMVNLLAYVRDVSTGPRSEFQMLPANPDHGAKLFQTKSCAVCHSLGATNDGMPGPALGVPHKLPRSIVQFAGNMWNHSPEMYRAAADRNLQRPQFEGRDMADLIAFLYSSRYFESGGTAEVGHRTFVTRGCGECHGRNAEGSDNAPSLRRRGEIFTSVSLATALWRHGPDMYRKCVALGRPWPKLSEQDVGDLVSYLSAPPEEKP